MKNTIHQALRAKPLGRGRFEVHVDLPDFLGLLSVVTGLFTACGMNIVGGKIRTVGKRAVDVFRVTAREVPDWEKIEQDLVTFVTKAKQEGVEAVRDEINERLIDYLRGHREFYSARLHPIHVRLHSKGRAKETVVDIHSQDTPAFLYELTNALSLLDINIVRMQVATRGDTVHDRLWVTHEDGKKITSQDKLRALQWAVLLIKQFTHLLPKVPDPARALREIVLFGKDVLERSDFDKILLNLKTSEALSGLSRVLGTSVYLWEEFIRSQHEPIVRILGDRAFLARRKVKTAMRRELAGLLAAKPNFAEKVEALNEFKDREIFRIDLRHLLGKTSYLDEFAGEFTDLVEGVVEEGRRLAREETLAKLPAPMISGRRGSEDAVFGLGKFGGRELGYASDVELLFIYTDDPDSSGTRSRKNLAFYCEMVRIFCSIIRARTEGVFEVDLRLRPYGKAGPLAVSLNLFRKYYSKTGEAWNFERQALVKLRHVAGSSSLGREVESIRNAFVYSDEPFNFKEAIELRERQRAELVEKGTWNAKYSSGGLLDVEYLTQTLQIIYGRKHDGDVRHPNTLRALHGLMRVRALETKKEGALEESYVFLRNLINALRIFRGNARDLTLPEWKAKEFTVLARRMGYSGDDAHVRTRFHRDLIRSMKRAQVLYRSEMTRIRELEKRLSRRAGRHELGTGQGPASWNGYLRDRLERAAKQRLKNMGFSDPESFANGLKRICAGDSTAVPQALAGFLHRAERIWNRVADPDLAWHHLERLWEAGGRGMEFWEKPASSSKGLEALLMLLGTSRYLAETLFSHPEYLSWLVRRENLTAAETRRELQQLSRQPLSVEDLRRVRHRETLRLALAEMLGQASVAETASAFSEVADFVLERVLGEFFGKDTVCVVGLGKLGGQELNFSSDVDLIFLAADALSPSVISGLQRYVRALEEGSLQDFLYRVDLRLRPHGDSGNLVLGLDDCISYYREQADFWEYLALIKTRPVAGFLSLGERLLAAVDSLVYRAEWPPQGIERLVEIKRRYEEATRARGEDATNVKMGAGGIRDIEFTVQILQLLHGGGLAALKKANTLEALREVECAGLLDGKACAVLREGYIFLRKIENHLQLYENQQAFNIPTEHAGLGRLARSLGFGDGPTPEKAFHDKLKRVKTQCRALFERVFFSRKP